MENINFKPTKELEFDIMKSLLDDYSKLSYFIELFQDSKFIWQNQMNQKLFALIERQFQKTKNRFDFEIENFYSKLLKMAKAQIPDFDVNVYLEFYEQNFKFYNSILNCYQFFKSKKVVKIMRELTDEIEKDKFDIDIVFATLDLVKKEIGGMLRTKIY